MNLAKVYTPQQYVVTCPNTDTNNTESYCIEAGKLCKTGTANQICSWNEYTDLAHTQNYSNATIVKQACVGAGLAADGVLPPLEGQSDNCSAEPESPTSSGTGTSTSTGEGTEGSSSSSSSTGTGTDTDPDTKEIYICALDSETRCADLLPDDALSDSHPNNSALDHCWSKVNPAITPPIYSKCASAFDKAEAKMLCKSRCDQIADAAEVFMKASCGWSEQDGWPVDCKIVTPLDCVIEDGDIALLSDYTSYECDGEPYNDATTGDTHLFLGLGSVTTPDGYSAGVTNVAGSIDYTISNCGSTYCDIEVDSILGLTNQLNGGFSDAAGSGGAFTVLDIGFQSTDALSGLWYHERGTVVFPSDEVGIELWSGSADIAGMTVPPMPTSYIELDQVVGMLASTEEPLSLSFSYSSIFGTATFSLTTVEE